MAEDFKRKLADMDDLNEDCISGKPWAQQLLADSLRKTKKAVLNWCNIVCKIGETEIDIDEYVSIFNHQVENIYEELITDVDAIRENSLDKIAQLLQKMQNLCRDLHTEMPNFSYEGIALGDLYRMIHQRVGEFESLAEIRRKELRELHQKQLQLCKNLGKEPKLLPESPLPLPQDIEALREYIEGLENDAMEREEKFFQLKEDIVEIVKELGTAPNLDFEREILDLTNSEVRIADNEMDQLKLYHDRLVNQLENVKEEIGELRQKVDDLWNKLETDIAERDAFRQKHVGNSLDSLHALKIEVNKLEEIKKANIKVFINKQRQELTELWDRCHCTESERKEFSFYHSECYNEDLFELHEREMEKWKQFYEENKEVFVLLQQYQNLWKEHLHLELNSDGANRYKNRGGQLLMEEKLRNQFRKKIPKIEERLLKLANAYLARRGKDFRTFGFTVEEYIQKLHEDEDRELKLKLSAKKQQREQASSVGRSRMNLFPPSGASAMTSTLTPRYCSKRKIIMTPATEPAKRLRPGTATKSSKTGLPKLNVSRNKRRSARREKLRQRLSFKSSKSSDKENQNETVSTSYNAFEKEVSMKNNCRSTGFVLQEATQNLIAVPVPPVKGEFLAPGLAYLPRTPRPKRGD